MSTTDESTTESLSDGRFASTDDAEGGANARSRNRQEDRIEELQSENQRLREEYIRAKQLKYRRTALALLGVGLVGVAAGITFPAERTVFLALGGTGIFGAALTYFIAPERVVPVSVGQSTYAAVGETGASIVDELGLSNDTVYVPVESTRVDTRVPVRLFVPQSEEYELPSSRALRSTFVSPEEPRRRGVAFTPTAGQMLEEFDRAVSGSVESEPAALTPQLCDALVEQFELVRTVEAEIDTADNRVTVGVSGCAYSPVTGFDHPIASFLGGGFAHGLGVPVTVETESVDDGEAEFLVTCRW